MRARPPRLCAINAAYEQYRVPPNHVYLRINQRPRGHHPWDRQHKRGEHNITQCHAQNFTTLPSRRRFSTSSSSSVTPPSLSLSSPPSRCPRHSPLGAPFGAAPPLLHQPGRFPLGRYLFIASCNIRRIQREWPFQKLSRIIRAGK